MNHKQKLALAISGGVLALSLVAVGAMHFFHSARLPVPVDTQPVLKPVNASRIPLSQPSQVQLDRKEEAGWLKGEMRLSGEVYRAPAWGIMALNVPKGTQLLEDLQTLKLTEEGLALHWEYVNEIGEHVLYQVDQLPELLKSVENPDQAGAKQAQVEAFELGTQEQPYQAFRVSLGEDSDQKRPLEYWVQAPYGGAYRFWVQRVADRPGQDGDQAQVEAVLKTLQLGQRQAGPRLYQDEPLGLAFFLPPEWEAVDESEASPKGDDTGADRPSSNEGFTGVKPNAGESGNGEATALTPASIALYSRDQRVRAVVTRMPSKVSPAISLGYIHDYLQTQRRGGALPGLASDPLAEQTVRGRTFYQTEVAFQNIQGQGKTRTQLVAFEADGYTYQLSLFQLGESREAADALVAQFMKTIRVEAGQSPEAAAQG